MTTEAAKKAPAKTPEGLGTEAVVQPELTPSEDERIAAQEQDASEAAREMDAMREQLRLVEAQRDAAEARASRFQGAAQLTDPSQVPMITSEYELAANALVPAEEGGPFTEEDTHRSWRIVARNPNYGGETEGFTFSRGEAIATALPQAASPERVRVRQLRLNGLRNYPFTYRTQNARGQSISKTEPGYRVLTEAQYEAEYADRIDDDELPPEDL